MVTNGLWFHHNLLKHWQTGMPDVEDFSYMFQGVMIWWHGSTSGTPAPNHWISPPQSAYQVICTDNYGLQTLQKQTSEVSLYKDCFLDGNLVVWLITSNISVYIWHRNSLISPWVFQVSCPIWCVSFVSIYYISMYNPLSNGFVILLPKACCHNGFYQSLERVSCDPT